MTETEVESKLNVAKARALLAYRKIWSWFIATMILAVASIALFVLILLHRQWALPAYVGILIAYVFCRINERRVHAAYKDANIKWKLAIIEVQSFLDGHKGDEQ